MSRKVYITSEMSFDERLLGIAEEDQLAALIWPWILTVFDDWGRAEAIPNKLKAKVFPGNEMVSANSIDSALHLYHKYELIQIYEVDDRQYMAISHKKWFKYQTHIRKSKREVDESRYPAPPIARECAQVSEESRENTPSPSPSTLPPYTFCRIDDDDRAREENDKKLCDEDSLGHEKTACTPGFQAIEYAKANFGQPLSVSETQRISIACLEFSKLNSMDADSIVIEALKRCVDNEPRDKLKYFKRIIRQWLDNGVVAFCDIERLDAEWAAGKLEAAQKTKGGSVNAKNFRNPRARINDSDSYDPSAWAKAGFAVST